MSTNNNQQTTEVANETQATNNPSFVSTVKGLKIALAGDLAFTPERVTMQFEYADTVSDKTGATWMRLHMKGLSIPLFRNLKQAAADLSNYIDSATAQFMTPLAFEVAFNKHFRNKEVNLSASAYDIGSKYVVDENSTAYKNGQAQLGETLTAESAGIRIDGFLRAMLSEAENNAVYEEQLRIAREQAQKIDSGAKFSIS